MLRLGVESQPLGSMLHRDGVVDMAIQGLACLTVTLSAAL